MVDEKLSLGRALKQRREDSLGQAWEFRQGDIAHMLDISQSTVSMIENDRAKLEYKPPKEVFRIVKAYRFSEPEAAELVTRFFAEYFDRLKSDMPLGANIDNPLSRTAGLPNVKVRFLGTVSAGLFNEGDEVDEGYLDTDARLLGGADPETSYWLEVVGSSMTCGDVRKSIPEGSYVLVDSRREPVLGRIIVAEINWQGKRFNVLKVYRNSDDGFLVLESYNKAHPPIVCAGGMEVRYKGTVIRKSEAI